MNTYFVMKKVCSFFLLKAQAPLSPTIITNVVKKSGMYYICIHTTNDTQIKSFIKRLEDVGTVSKAESAVEAECYFYEAKSYES